MPGRADLSRIYLRVHGRLTFCAMPPAVCAARGRFLSVGSKVAEASTFVQVGPSRRICESLTEMPGHDGSQPALGRAIRKLRAERGSSQAALAERAGLTVAALSRIERGRADPTWGTVIALARGARNEIVADLATRSEKEIGTAPISFETTVRIFRNTDGISALNDTLTDEISKVFTATWSVRDGQVVPKTEDVLLSNGAVKLHAVVLYADLARSTQLAMDFDRSVAAKVVRAYLATMTRLVKANGGTVRSFDGDRVMGVFVGDRKNTNAAECAFRMNHLVTKLLRPKAEAKFPSLKSKGFVIQHGVGMSRSGDALVSAALAYRGSNDLVFVGAAPNIAAKLE